MYSCLGCCVEFAKARGGKGGEVDAWLDVQDQIRRDLAGTFRHQQRAPRPRTCSPGPRVMPYIKT